METKLNLGCGKFKKEGYKNLDYDPRTKPDVLHDLNVFPYPFKDNIFDEVYSSHVLEHLDKPFEVMAQIHRILKPKGKLTLLLPHFSRGMTNTTHKHCFDVAFPFYFQKDYQGTRAGDNFKLISMKFNWFGQPDLKITKLGFFKYNIGLYLGKVFTFLANLSPYACSRIWCFWVGGFDEIKFEMEKEK